MSQAFKVASQPGHAPRGTSSRWPNSQAGEPSPPDLPQEKDRQLKSRDSHLRLAAGGWENDLKSSSTSEAPPLFVMQGECRLRVRAPHARLVQCRDGWTGQGFTASREAAPSRAYVTRFWESPGCGMCFRARRRLSRRERMAGECGRVLSGPLVPSLIRSYRAEARITANVAQNAIHRGRPQFPVGRWTDRINWSLTTGALRQCQLPAVYVKGELYKTRVASRWTMNRSIIPSQIDERR